MSELASSPSNTAPPRTRPTSVSEEAEFAPQLPFPRPDVLSVAPLYAQLRATAPLCAVRTPAGDPAWLVTSHALTRELLADPRLGRSTRSPNGRHGSPAPRCSAARWATRPPRPRATP